MKNNNLPIFPLGIVALPGTIQNLQIFEPRYINMVKSCMKNDQGFVITFQKKLSDRDGYEVSHQGTYVEIIDFNNLPNGLLGITVKAINRDEINPFFIDSFLWKKFKRINKIIPSKIAS